MRLALRVVGNLLIGASALALVGLAAITFLPPDRTAPALGAVRHAASGLRLPPFANAGASADGDLQAADPPASDAARAAAGLGTAENLGGRAELDRSPQRPITHLVVPAIGLDADVVDSALVAVDGGLTWQVPAFKVGHAESTAGAGEVGNAVLLGHVTSVHSGNVFADLDQVKVGDLVQVYSDSERFDYHVVSTRAIPRADSDVLQPTQSPSVSLITCTGVWLPTIWDYTERLVVHAELSQ